MKRFIRKYGFLLLFIITGATAGLLYWHFIGCTSGSCPITSKWQNSTIYGGILGYVTGSIFKKDKKSQDNEKENAG